jgi:hypothetical protein
MNVGANASSIGKLHKSNHDLDASKNVKCGRANVETLQSKTHAKNFLCVKCDGGLENIIRLE